MATTNPMQAMIQRQLEQQQASQAQAMPSMSQEQQQAVAEQEQISRRVESLQRSIQANRELISEYRNLMSQETNELAKQRYGERIAATSAMIENKTAQMTALRERAGSYATVPVPRIGAQPQVQISEPTTQELYTAFQNVRTGEMISARESPGSEWRQVQVTPQGEVVSQAQMQPSQLTYERLGYTPQESQKIQAWSEKYQMTPTPQTIREIIMPSQVEQVRGYIERPYVPQAEIVPLTPMMKVESWIKGTAEKLAETPKKWREEFREWGATEFADIPERITMPSPTMETAAQVSAFGKGVRGALERLGELVDYYLPSRGEVSWQPTYQSAFFGKPVAEKVTIPKQETLTYRAPKVEELSLKEQSEIKVMEDVLKTQDKVRVRVEDISNKIVDDYKKDYVKELDKLQKQIDNGKKDYDVAVREASELRDRLEKEILDKYNKTVNPIIEQEEKALKERSEKTTKEYWGKAGWEALPVTFGVPALLSFIPGVSLAVGAIGGGYALTHPAETLRAINEEPLLSGINMAAWAVGPGVKGITGRLIEKYSSKGKEPIISETTGRGSAEAMQQIISQYVGKDINEIKRQVTDIKKHVVRNLKEGNELEFIEYSKRIKVDGNWETVRGAVGVHKVNGKVQTIYRIDSVGGDKAIAKVMEIPSKGKNIKVYTMLDESQSLGQSIIKGRTFDEIYNKAGIQTKILEAEKIAKTSENVVKPLFTDAELASLDFKNPYTAAEWSKAKLAWEGKTISATQPYYFRAVQVATPTGQFPVLGEKGVGFQLKYREKAVTVTEPTGAKMPFKKAGIKPSDIFMGARKEAGFLFLPEEVISGKIGISIPKTKPRIKTAPGPKPFAWLATPKETATRAFFEKIPKPSPLSTGIPLSIAKGITKKPSVSFIPTLKPLKEAKQVQKPIVDFDLGKGGAFAGLAAPTGRFPLITPKRVTEPLSVSGRLPDWLQKRGKEEARKIEKARREAAKREIRMIQPSRAVTKGKIAPDIIEKGMKKASGRFISPPKGISRARDELFTITRPSQIIKQPLKLRLEQAQMQRQRLEQRLVPRLSLTETLRTPKGISLISAKGKVGKVAKAPITKLVPAYIPYIKTKGIWKPIGPALPKPRAVWLGERVARTTAAASFKVMPTKKLIKAPKGKYVPSPLLFRGYRIKKGKKVPLTDEFIQFRAKRILSVGEKREISLKGARARRKSIW